MIFLTQLLSCEFTWSNLFAVFLYKDLGNTGGSQGLSQFNCDWVSPVQKVYSEIPLLLNVPVQSTESNVVTQWKQVETIAAQTHIGNL